MNKYLLIGAVVVLAGIGGWVFFDQAPASSPTGSASTTQNTNTQQSAQNTPNPSEKSTQTSQTNGSLTVSSANGDAPFVVVFSIKESAGGQYIDFGDGTNPCSPMTSGFVMDEGGCMAPAYPQTFSHTYTAPGTYKVTASRQFPSSTLGIVTITVR
jgi:hypothetical protein